MVHEKCRKDYTRDDSIKSKVNVQLEDKRECKFLVSPVKSKLRSENPKFDFKRCCLFCSKECNKDREKKKPILRRQKIWNVSTAEFKERILEKSRERSDFWGKQLSNRVCQVSCLVAEKDVYHEKCVSSFMQNMPVTKKRG